jgi:two-component system, chemotaxis family, sensor kinase CheA
MDEEKLQEIIREFLIESHENLDQLDQDLVVLERDPSRHEVFDNIFRTMHTLKGSCAVLGYSKLESIAHTGESLLDYLRNGQLRVSTDITSALLATADAVRNTLRNIEQHGAEGDEDYSDLIARLKCLQVAGGAPAMPPLATEERPLYDRLGEMESITKSVKLFVSGSAEERRASLEPPAADGENTHTLPESAVSESTIRVDVELLDKLITLVGEMVLARNQILQFAAQEEDSAFLATVQRLNLITSELQEAAMKTRMQPIGNIWSRFPRVVRDLSVACGKKIRLDMDGRKTELDKSILEAIRAPLMHLVRNAVDHGIELPKTRVAAGKPPQGCLSLRAFHEGGNVNIEISDDGAGIDPERVKRRAVERKLISTHEADRMSPAEIVDLIFLPGFSTAEKVTNVSGRGVGMDVARSNLEKVSGTIEVESKPGEGATFKIKIPLTLAIIPALVVTCRRDCYAIPQVSLLELVRLDVGQTGRGIELVHGAPIYRLRGNLLPLVFLDQVLQGNGNATSPSERPGNGIVNIVVLQADDRMFGLVVEGINDTEEIVVKPLGKRLKGVTCFAGAAIRGDGRVALILDVPGLARHTKVVSEAKDRTAVHRSNGQETGEKKDALLVFGVKGNRMAIPLSIVARLEEFDQSSIEQVGSQEVVQYRGAIMPLIRLSSALEERRSRPRERKLHDQTAAGATIQVVVYSEDGHSVGFVVDQIFDIVEETLKTQQRATRRGVLGTAVLQGRVTELVDVRGVIRMAAPQFFQHAVAAGERG